MDKRYLVGKHLREMVGYDNVDYFPADAQRLMRDWIIIDEIMEANQYEISLFDYSFAMAPMYKALESVLWKIADDLGLVKKGEQLGSFFNEENIDKILPKIKKKIGSGKKLKEIRGNLCEIKDFLIRYRHSPAHSGFYFKTLKEEKLAANSALHNIKCLVQDLLEVNIIEVPPTEEEKDVDPLEDDLPF